MASGLVSLWSLAWVTCSGGSPPPCGEDTRAAPWRPRGEELRPLANSHFTGESHPGAAQPRPEQVPRPPETTEPELPSRVTARPRGLGDCAMFAVEASWLLGSCVTQQRWKTKTHGGVCLAPDKLPSDICRGLHTWCWGTWGQAAFLIHPQLDAGPWAAPSARVSS